jgi:hypothetical protein
VIGAKAIGLLVRTVGLEMSKLKLIITGIDTMICSGKKIRKFLRSGIGLLR